MDIKDLKELVKFIEKSGFTEFEYETDNVRVYLSKNVQVGQVIAPQVQPQVVTAAQPMTTVQTTEKVVEKKSEELSGNPNLVEVKSPIVGTFYEAPAPGAEPFVKEGDIVKKGKTLCIIEAMKIMNEIEAEFDCKIVKKVGKNGVPVEFGETIFLVEKV
ncbi:acetyl-CoA carboxylase biotin carboxyl carrier protein [Calditerrivibrio nitroreducens]|uniref:Biotin carboxyl carrier protein of acetyl-CoA carboxylase n=1 Tax=Calditerrivibrio nitroreducens (strain DSM 19672 / NBRC 101217 / Yu37-1) TaxID=768670 RepID=E4TJI5_CALNY|nr:acetyl-CoA carboxylase biotin carboxyl carrier protein [Calditerrivibrio nitroreducens]ADR18147.1 biotin carboxyl carrier protein [Calditerrivibrio nitroreducens DSM 19672]